MSARADCNGALEISMTPLYGLYISNIRKIAPDTDNAAVNNALSYFKWLN
jgi:hypothetical protein